MFTTMDWKWRLKRGILSVGVFRQYRMLWYAAHKKASYSIEKTAEGNVILCNICMRWSFHPMDVREKYCPFCSRWH